jgi:hypothetical protein
MSRRVPVILFYNTCFGSYPDISRFECEARCEFIIDRSRIREADAVVFHLPSPREFGDAIKYPGQIWVGWSMESGANTPITSKPAIMRHFDLHMNFRRSADIWCPYLPWRADWERALAQPPFPKTAQAAAVHLQSAMIDRCGRNAYVAELMTHMAVDSYGRFRPNRPMPAPDRGPPTKLELIRGDRFCLAFENTIEPDYVTEKFYQPLLAGTVPVYRGAPNIDEFAPGDHCYIDATRFDSPRELAQYLSELACNEAAYSRYLEWRKQPLRRSFVELLERSAGESFCRLAALVAQRLNSIATERPRGRPIRPLGWRPYVRARLGSLRRRLIGSKTPKKV